ncbi:MAG: hypothetical protein P1P84_22365, partial [Deferrisomatales bacterium]|nr:hypothetical protein [Deferrisomatales bacterium]
SDTFTVLDCNNVPLYESLGAPPYGFTPGETFSVDGTFVPDANPNAPTDQGGISSKTPSNPTPIPGPSVSISVPWAGTPPEYDVTYTTPICTLDPSRVPTGIQPEIRLDLVQDPGGTILHTPAQSPMQLDSCLDSCAIEASIDGGIT